jgi:hypothetical protein
MFGRTTLAVLTLVVGMAVGFTLSGLPAGQSAAAQDAGQILVKGHGRAISSRKPPDSEQFTLYTSNAANGSFKVVPAGKKFVLTDVMYIAQGNVRQDLAVNMASAYPIAQKSKVSSLEVGHSILFQVRLSPGESDQVHLCSGYVIPAGSVLIAFTNAGLEPEQYVSVSVTGYLVDE